MTVWQQQLRTPATAIAIIVNGGSGGIESMVPMAPSLTVTAVDGSGNDGVFTTTSHNNNCQPPPHGPCPLLDKDWTAGWRVRRDTSHSLLPRLLLLAPSLSPLARQWRQGRRPWQQTRPSHQYLRLGRDGTPRPHWHGATKTKTKQKQKQNQNQKQNQLQWWQRHHLCACRQLRLCCCRCCLCISRGSRGGSMGVAVAVADLLRVSYSQRTLGVSYSQRHLCNHNPLQKLLHSNFYYCTEINVSTDR